MIRLLGNYIRSALGEWSNKELWQARIVLWFGAILIGAVASGFAELSHWADGVSRNLYSDTPYVAFILLPIGFVILRLVTSKFVPTARGSGIPQSIAAMRLGEGVGRSKLLSLWAAAAKLFFTVFGHLCGASIGREGPTVFIGSTILNFLGRYAHFSKAELQRGLIIAGGAAGISAAFNTPLAGIVFAIEELSRSFEERTSYVTLSAVVLAGLTSIALMGNYNYFGYTAVTVHWNQAVVYALLMGVVAGALGGIFGTILLYFGEQFSRFSFKKSLYLAAGCGLIVATAGFLSGGIVYGAGSHHTFNILAGQVSHVPFYQPLLKMVATLASYFSGIPGGLFAPALSTGADLGQFFSQIFPQFPGPAFAILGMVAYLSGVVQSPITAFVIVMEMVDSHRMIVPMMVASFVGLGAGKVTCPRPLYRTLADIYIKKYS